MDFQTAIQVCFSKYVDFTGRARRSEFWYFALFNLIIASATSIIDFSLRSNVVGDLVSLALFLPYLAVAVRRMHDIGKSGWFILIPIYNIVLFAQDSDPAPNQFGVPVK
ncbi:MAG: hypothetical protein RL228_1379 [Actinomycetota bacterium]|jgi:uncharacterized membrane protein YhaH (DUF805 family)